MRIFSGLLLELRIKLDLTKDGLAADKTKRLINFGLPDDDQDPSMKQKKNAKLNFT